MQAEIADLKEFTRLAVSIDHNAKGKALLAALRSAFDKASELGAAEKAIIFTESRKTQSYLLRLLADSPYADGIVLFNGTNTDDQSKAIYARWAARHQGSDKITGSRTADMRSALVDYFREEGRIMIATEAGAEGINLQFCALVVNYDLPWNPQRIAQRIARCHRYDQKHDVVVVNFLNQKNEADLHVYQLLNEKFNLFTGVFGSSDEVLGTIESGVDFEMRIAAIYQSCRKPEQIKEAFDELQLELNFEINEAMRATRQKLLENFDEEVQSKLKLRDENSRAFLSHFEKQLIALTRHELRDDATFHSDSSFSLHSLPPDIGSTTICTVRVASASHPNQSSVISVSSAANPIPLGLYVLPRSTSTAHVYRLGHPLADHLLTRAKERSLPPAELDFHYAEHGSKISILEPLRGQSGTLTVSLFTVESMDQAEDHLIYASCTDDGTLMDQEQSRRLLSLPAVTKATLPDLPIPVSLNQITATRQSELQKIIAARNGHYYEAEAEKLDGWADDLKVGLEREIKEMDRLIKDARRSAATALTLEDKLAAQKQIKAVEAQRNDKRRSLFDAQDAIDLQRENLIGTIEGKLNQLASTQPLLPLRWSLVCPQSTVRQPCRDRDQT